MRVDGFGVVVDALVEGVGDLRGADIVTRLQNKVGQVHLVNHVDV